MKKLARLSALLLTGALLRMLSACGAAPGGSASMTPEEIAAKQRLLGEINSYRATLEFAAPLEEVKQLSDAEQIWVEQFRAAGKTERADSQAREHGQDASDLGASAIVTACVSCTFQLMMAQREVPVFHYLELLFNWRIDWYHADAYMKLRFLFDDSLGVEKQGQGARNFVGLGGEEAAKEDA